MNTSRWQSFVNRSSQVIAHKTYERVIMRALFAALVFHSIRWDVNLESQPRPNGIAHWVDLTFFSNPSVMSVLQPLVIVALALYVIGRLSAIALILPILVTVGVGTLINSQGAIGHSSQLVTMMLIGQAAVYWIHRPTKDIPTRKSLMNPSVDTENLAIHIAKVVIAAGYLASALMKIKNSGGMWIADVPYLSIQFIKTNMMEYYNSLEEVGGHTREIPALILAHPMLARVIFGGGLFAEFFCFLGLLGRGWSLIMGVSLIVLHLTVSAAMNLTFDQHIAALAIFYINLPGLPVMVREMMAKRREP